MLFKTLSAAVFGIDAYLVEVEVDVGSARMNDFNVVGLPDNAVKESRERIKSALRNCGIEFPYGQGVTINLAPADIKKEGSAFDLPMALGLAGCMGQFFGKPINKMMFLGELSLDGSIRPVRGALSAALAARDSGLIALAVPEANAREAAVVDGIKIYAVKTLPQTVDLVNAPESFSPTQVDAQLLLSEAAKRVAHVLERRAWIFPAPILFHRVLAQVCEWTMKVPLVAKAQVQILIEGVVEPATACDPLPAELVPVRQFTPDQIRSGLPEPGAFGIRDLRCCW